MKGGVTRAKEHLMAKKGNVDACTKTPKNVRKADSSSFNPRYTATNNNHESEDEVKISTASNDKGRNSSGRKGPMDMFYRNPTATIEKRKKEKLRQANIKEACDKNLKASIHQYIARFWYQAGLSFNLVKLKSFQDMIDAIGTNLIYPLLVIMKSEFHFSTRKLSTLKSCYKIINWNGANMVVLLCQMHGLIETKQCLINFLVSSPAGTMFVKSIDGSNFVKIGEKLFEMLDSLVEEIGEENVVQVITDSGSNYVLA